MGTYSDMRNRLVESKLTEANEKVLSLIKQYQIQLYEVMNDDDKHLEVQADFLIDAYSLLKQENYKLDNSTYDSTKENPIKRIQNDILTMSEQAGCKEAVLNSGLLIKLKNDQELYENTKIKNYVRILEER